MCPMLNRPLEPGQWEPLIGQFRVMWSPVEQGQEDGERGCERTYLVSAVLALGREPSCGRWHGERSPSIDLGTREVPVPGKGRNIFESGAEGKGDHGKPGALRWQVTGAQAPCHRGFLRSRLRGGGPACTRLLGSVGDQHLGGGRQGAGADGGKAALRSSPSVTSASPAGSSEVRTTFQNCPGSGQEGKKRL